MKKYYPYILICLIVVGLFAPVHFAHAGWFDVIPGPAVLVKGIIQVIGEGILQLLSYITGLAGLILNYIIWYTILQFKANLDTLDGINTAWQVMKDIMNIFFIFILIYQAIMLIISQENTDKIGRFIVMVVLASILINFSLFFTKVMIDASNVVTVGLYNGMVANPDASTGLSDPIMTRLGLQKQYDPGSIAPDIGAGKGVGTMIVYIFGAGAFQIVTAFVFFAVAVLFAVRYVTLLLLLMLSPIAYMGMALSFMQDGARMWWNALKSQLIFPPVFMLLMWITLTLLGSQGFINQGVGVAMGSVVTGQAPDQGVLSAIFNFFILNSLMIYSLVLSKQISAKGSSYLSKATGMATSFAGGVMGGIAGTTAWAGRKTAGRVGSAIADNAELQRSANEDRGAKGAWSRMKLYGAQTARDATYDVRNATVPTSVIGETVRGTIGRTQAGQFFGMDRTDTSSWNVPVGASVAKSAGLGAGSKLSYVQEKEASDKAKATRDARAREERDQALAKRDISDGAKAKEGDANYTETISKMETAISNLSAKEIETLVSNNKQLLESQEFATRINIKQLEAIEKSDKFSDEEKGKIKTARFKSISDIDLGDEEKYKIAKAKSDSSRTKQEKETVQYWDAKSKDESARSEGEKDFIKKIDARIISAKGKIKGLSDSELEMIDANTLFNNSNFVSELRSAQVESINKKDSFTSSQKKALKTTRLAPLLASVNDLKLSDINLEENKAYFEALTAPNPTEIQRNLVKETNEKISKARKTVEKMVGKNLSSKDIAGLMSNEYETEVTDPSSPNGKKKVSQSILLHPEFVRQYSPGQLKKMAADMSSEDIAKVRDAIESTVKSELAKAGGDIKKIQDKKVAVLAKWIGKDDYDNFS